MLKAGIIKRFDKPTDWCSMAFFLPKGPDPVRMVFDFRHLSSWSTRVGYPFSSSESVLRSIPSKAKVFLSLDLLQSYFQLKVHQDDWELLVFILPSGKFIVCRAPMDHHGSGDDLNIASRCLLIGLEQAIKIMDDVLLAACSLKEAYLIGQAPC